MLNVGEQFVASYLRYIRECDFIQTNLYTVDTQGEIDVVGIDLKGRRVYICEVAIHLTTGLQYVKDKRPDNVARLTAKFSRDIEYARTYLDGYEPHFMLWSPIVKNTGGQAQYNQMGHLHAVKENIRARYGIELECVINGSFLACLQEMRAYCAKQTTELQCPLMRLMQLESHLTRHVAKTASAVPSGALSP